MNGTKNPTSPRPPGPPPATTNRQAARTEPKEPKEPKVEVHYKWRWGLGPGWVVVHLFTIIGYYYGILLYNTIIIVNDEVWFMTRYHIIGYYYWYG